MNNHSNRAISSPINLYTSVGTYSPSFKGMEGLNVSDIRGNMWAYARMPICPTPKIDAFNGVWIYQGW